MDIIFWGATGQAKVLRELVEPAATLIAVFDNADVPPPFVDVPLYRGRDGFVAWLAKHRGPRPDCLVAIGGTHGADRHELQRFLAGHGLAAPVAVHRTAFVAADAQLGAGTQVLAQAVVCVGARLGEACIVNTAASVDHECDLGDGVHVAPGARLAGGVRVGDYAMIGTGAVILPRISIGVGAVVGAGSVVTRDVPAHSVVVGNPARVTRKPPGS